MVYWNKYMNKSDVHTMNTFYTQLTDQVKVEDELIVLLERGPTLFCLNDGVLHRRKAQGTILRIFLEFYFPDQSIVENPIIVPEQLQLSPSMSKSFQSVQSESKSQHFNTSKSQTKQITKTTISQSQTLFGRRANSNSARAPNSALNQNRGQAIQSARSSRRSQ
jgi:hypothetical protein